MSSGTHTPWSLCIAIGIPLPLFMTEMVALKERALASVKLHGKESKKILSSLCTLLDQWSLSGCPLWGPIFQISISMRVFSSLIL
jgi:hypothetical protein